MTDVCDAGVCWKSYAE